MRDEKNQYRGHGLMRGHDVDDSATENLYGTPEEAEEACRREWMFWLSEREKQQADVYAAKE